MIFKSNWLNFSVLARPFGSGMREQDAQCAEGSGKTFSGLFSSPKFAIIKSKTNFSGPNRVRQIWRPLTIASNPSQKCKKIVKIFEFFSAKEWWTVCWRMSCAHKSMRCASRPSGRQSGADSDKCRRRPVAGAARAWQIDLLATCHCSDHFSNIWPKFCIKKKLHKNMMNLANKN